MGESRIPDLKEDLLLDQFSSKKHMNVRKMDFEVVEALLIPRAFTDCAPFVVFCPPTGILDDVLELRITNPSQKHPWLIRYTSLVTFNEPY